MCRVLLIVLLFIAGMMLAPLVAAHRGYVLVVVGPYRIEMTVIGLLIFLLLVLVAMVGIGTLLKKIWQLKDWLGRRRRARANDHLWQALFKGIEGDYQQVEKLLAGSARHSEQPLLHYLLSAEAARQQGHWLRVKQYLAQAESWVKSSMEPQHSLALKICWIRLQLATQRIAEARSGIDTLLLTMPNHSEVRCLAQQLDKIAAVDPSSPCVP